MSWKLGWEKKDTDKYVRRATLSDHFFFSDYEAMHKLALMLRHLPLPLRDAYTFAISPADPDDPIVSSALLSFATAYSQRCAVCCCHLSGIGPAHFMAGFTRTSFS